MRDNLLEDARMEPTDTTVHEELARQDLVDIIALRESDAFNRYWMRRLKQKRVEVETAFKYGLPQEVSKDRREELRQQLLVYEGLEKMMDVEAGNIKASMQRPQYDSP